MISSFGEVLSVYSASVNKVCVLKKVNNEKEKLHHVSRWRVPNNVDVAVETDNGLVIARAVCSSSHEKGIARMVTGHVVSDSRVPFLSCVKCPQGGRTHT